MIGWIDSAKVSAATLAFLLKRAGWTDSTRIRDNATHLFVPPKKTKPHETPAQFGFETEESASQRIKTIIVGVSKDLGYPNVTEQATLLRRGDYGITLYRELKESIPLRLEEAINRKVWSAMIDAYEETAGLKRKNLRPGLKPPNLEDDNFKLFLADLQPRLKAIFPKVTGIMLNRESGGIQGAATNRAARDVIIAKFLKGKI